MIHCGYPYTVYEDSQWITAGVQVVGGTPVSGQGRQRVVELLQGGGGTSVDIVFAAPAV